MNRQAYMPGVGNPESTPFLAYGPTARPDSWLLAGVPHTICQVHVPSSGPAWTFSCYVSIYICIVCVHVTLTHNLHINDFKLQNRKQCSACSDLSTICSICSMYLYHIMRKGSGGEASGKSVGIYKHFFSCNLSVFRIVISQVAPSFSLYRYRNQPHQFHEFTGK